MLERDLERIATQLTTGILASLRAATLEDLADVLPQVRKLVDANARRPAVAPVVRATPKPASPTVPRVRDGALGEQIVRALSKSSDGMRSEQLQATLRVSTLPLRAMLNEMLAAGRIRREGQARGTRYLVAGRAETPAVVKEAPVEVDVDAMNGIRAHLAGSTVPLSLHEIEEQAQLSRAVVRAAVEKLISLGFASRHGHGPGVRYHLATRAPMTQSSPTDGPRVVRRPPRAKTWTTAPADIGAPAVSVAPTV